MLLQISSFTALLAFPLVAWALPTEEVPAHLRGKRSFELRDGVKRTIFEHEATGATLSFVTNSGICETTPGVNQYSGYVTTGSKSSSDLTGAPTQVQIAGQNMWFWFFESRNSSTTAPLATWFNGGPGCSSMIGLFQVFCLSKVCIYGVNYQRYTGEWSLSILQWGEYAFHK
jgi:carboxypeptidase C (cathepsin A)